MQIIISPAKKMRVDNDDLSPAAKPFFLKETETLLAAAAANVLYGTTAVVAVQC